MTDDKEQKAEGTTKEKPADDIGAGDKSQTISELDRADQIAERQKRENDRRESLLTREENLEARRKIGGLAEAGKPSEKKEESDHDYRMRIQKELAEGKTEFGN